MNFTHLSFSKLSLLIVFVIAFSGLSHAQDTSGPRPALLVRDSEGQQVGLKMNLLKVDVKVVGKLATTTLDMTFYNGENRDLKAELVFPLGEGQSVSRFAMDVTGKLREGVVVEKNKGQEVFETIVRRKIDPGLLEWTKGNNFKANVYPVPANGHKRIVVAYEQELQASAKGLLYLLPMNFPDVLDQFDLKVEVFRQKVSPVLQKNELANLRFERWEENFVAEMHETNYAARKQLGFAVPLAKSSGPAYLEKGADGQQYFFFNVTPKVEARKKKAPQRIAIVWDASASAANRDRERELALLDAYFAQLGTVELDLVTFNIAAGRPQSSAVRAGQWSALRSILTAQACDGATQLGCLDLRDYAADEILLISDGISNFGKALVTPGSQPVYCISSGPSAEHSYLRSLAEQTGGTYIPLQETTTEAGLQLLSTQPYRFLRATWKGDALSATYPDHPSVVRHDFSFAGILQGNKASVTLEFGIGKRVLHRETVQLDASQATESGMVQRMWAQKKLASLDRNPKLNEKEIVALGKSQSLVTRYTSLIVLETLEDYLEFDIVPPKDLQEAFYAQRSKAEKDEKAAVEEHLDYVREAWEKRKIWWEKKFSWDAPKSMKKRPKGQADSLSFDIDEFDSQDDDWGEVEEVAEERVVDLQERINLSGGNAVEQVRSQNLSLEDAEDDWGGDEFGEFDSEEEGWGDVETNDNVSLVDGKKGKGKGRGQKGETEVKAWDPDEPYLKALEAATPGKAYAVYLAQRAEFANAPSFYLDCSDFFLAQKDKATALLVLSNIAEMKLQDYRLFRVLGHRLMQLGYAELAVSMFEQVMEIRKEEPQSYRDLAHAMAASGRHQEAVDLLWTIVQKPWDDRFPEIELIALEEMNAIIQKAPGRLNLSGMDKDLLENLPLDIRVVLNWDANNCDMDLWVIDPHGEKCYYSNRETRLGGWMSRDFTGGYGPEEFLIHRAKPGKYKVMVHFFSDSQQTLTGATTVQVQLITNFGKPNEKVQEVTRRLKSTKQDLEIGTVTF